MHRGDTMVCILTNRDNKRVGKRTSARVITRKRRAGITAIERDESTSRIFLTRVWFMNGLLSKNVVTPGEFADRKVVFPRPREKWFYASSFSSLELLSYTTLTLFRRPNFLQFWRGANFVGEINARFTRCYENRIYVFVNPPHIVVLLLRPFDVIFHSRVAIGNIFTIFCFRRNRV